MAYELKLPQWSGPLEKLLELIEVHAYHLSRDRGEFVAIEEIRLRKPE